MSKGLPRSMSRGAPLRQEIIKQNIKFTKEITITGVDSSVDAGTAVIGDLPQGNILLLGATAYVKVDATGQAEVTTNWGGDFGIGTVPQNDVDLADAGEDNIIASTPVNAVSSTKASAVTRGASTQTENGQIFDNTDGSLELNLNLLIDDNVITDDEDGVFTVSGVLHIAYIVLGDD